MYNSRRKLLDSTLGKHFDEALRQWSESQGRDSELNSVAQKLSIISGDNTNVYNINVLSEQPLDYSLVTLSESFDLKQNGPRVGDYPDRGYINNIIVPHYTEVRAEGVPSVYRVQTQIQGRLAVYERLILPFTRNGSVVDCLSVSRLELLVEDFVPPSFPVLSPREKQVLGCLASGLGYKQIAPKLGVSEKTVEKHIASMKSKLDAKTLPHLVVRGLQCMGVVDVDLDEPRG